MKGAGLRRNLQVTAKRSALANDLLACPFKVFVFCANVILGLNMEVPTKLAFSLQNAMRVRQGITFAEFYRNMTFIFEYAAETRARGKQDAAVVDLVMSFPRVQRLQ